MYTSFFRSSSVFASLILITLLSGFSKVPDEIQKTPPFIISPNQVSDGAPFKLELLSHRYSCAVTYSHLSYSVDGTKIYLRFLPDHSKEPISVCPMIYKPYGPTFDLKGLKAGTYSVFAVPLVPCMVENPMCKIAVIPEPAGTLTVGKNPVTHNWKLQPPSAQADIPFQLQLLSQNYGNCQTEFSHTSATLKDGELWLTYFMQTHPERVCVWDQRPFGPEFKLPGLKAGRYPVIAMQLLSDPDAPIQLPAFSTEKVGVLEIFNGQVEWPQTWVEPKKVAEGKAFELELWSNGFNCNSQFSDKQVAIQGNNIHLTFSYGQTKMMCPAVVKPYNTTFRIPSLKKGVYHIMARENDPCMLNWTQIPCASSKIADRPFDSLVVGDGSVALSPESQSPRMLRQGGRALISLPGEAVKHAELEFLSLSGESLGRTRVAAEANTLALEWPQGIQPGLYGIRVTVPGRAPVLLKGLRP